MKYGLIGKNVSNSFSKLIHNSFNNFSYELKSLNKNEFDRFFCIKNFNGINVTTPYKLKVFSYVDRLDEVAKLTKSINTIINKNGTLFGYNTDYDGFKYLLYKNNIEIKGKRVAVLGTGGAALTVAYVLHELKAKEVIFVSRQIRKNAISYEELKDRQIDVLINATPRGMTQRSFLPLINLKRVKGLQVVVDLIATPLKTILLQDAEALSIKAINGLDMLIEQARVAEELFQNKSIDAIRNDDIKEQIIFKYLNIVLIGMPYSGKSTIGKLLSEKMDRDFIDLDEVVCEQTGIKTRDYIKIYGEKAFRLLEHKIVKNVAFSNAKVIATGGGVVLNKINIKLLKQNAIVVFLKRNVNDIVFNNMRPLTLNKKMYLITEQKRKHLYRKAMDYLVENKKLIDSVEEIVRKYYEIINN